MRKFIIIGICFLAALAAFWWLTSHRSTVVNAQFGRAKLSHRVYAPQVKSPGDFVTKKLFFSREDTYLHVGPIGLDWTSGSAKVGAFLFYAPFSNDAVWEFAPCSKTNLADVQREDLAGHFCGVGSVDGATVFGHQWKDRGILVKEGDIVLARLTQKSEIVYAVWLEKQKADQELLIQFLDVDVSVRRPNKSPEPTAVGAVSSAVAVHVASRRWLSFLR